MPLERSQNRLRKWETSDSFGVIHYQKRIIKQNRERRKWVLMNSVKHHQHPLLIIKIYKVFYLLQRYNSKMSSIERANHQHPLFITQHLSAHQHLTPFTQHYAPSNSRRKRVSFSEKRRRSLTRYLRLAIRSTPIPKA